MVKKCVKMVVKSGLETSWKFQQFDGRNVERDSIIVENERVWHESKEGEE